MLALCVIVRIILVSVNFREFFRVFVMAEMVFAEVFRQRG
jgi:hypothetical protein